MNESITRGFVLSVYFARNEASAGHAKIKTKRIKVWFNDVHKFELKYKKRNKYKID